jgi:NAD(P)-dependent dehydrogenase (short-subunit alcohol dehydrogenase family)
MTTGERNVMDLLSLQGRVAIVTGAVGWLGSAMSRALAEAGATVAVTSRDADRAMAFAATLPGSGHIGVGFSQSDTGTIPHFIGEVEQRLGRIDILVNNAYGGSSRADIDGETAEAFDQAYHVGVTAYFLLAREVMFRLRARRAPGSIINIASMYGVIASYPGDYEGLPLGTAPSYFAFKGGLLQLTRHLAVYWAPYNIRVNAISPGPFPKPERALPDFISRLESRVPLGRVGRPEELKGAVVLLASDAGSYITGQNLLVDGGWTAW